MSIFKEDIYSTELFEKWIDEKYFNVMMMLNRNPRYQNQRAEDCFVKMFIDENGIARPLSWGIPKPNPEAAYKSLAKYAKSILPMDEDEVYDMNLAWSWTERHFGLYMKDSRVFTLEEAIQELDMSTSSGSPFNTVYPKKKELFEKDESITAWLEKDWNLLGEDPNWTCVATNSLKEELRTKEKMDANSIRTFTSMPVDATVHGTRLFVDMNQKMYKSHLKTASAVGMSPYEGNWNILYKKLNVFRNGYALDEKEYDSSLRAYLMWGCAQFRYKMLRKEDRTSENKLRIQTYYRNLINTLILTPEGIIIQKKTGNPSGSCNTITDNTLILYTLMAYAWIRTSKKEYIDYCNYEDFEILTAKALVGDDNTWTVSDDAHEFYNGRTVIEVWKTLGITTTTDSLEPREAEYLDFLSAQFLPMRGVMVPIYDREKIMNSVYYSPKKDHSPCVTLERTAALLSIGWTDLQIRKFCRELIDYLMQKYDTVLREDPHWIRAKTQIQSDEVYEERFTGIRCFPQGIIGHVGKHSGNTTEKEDIPVKFLDEEWMNFPAMDFIDLTQWDQILQEEELSGEQERLTKPDKKVLFMSTKPKRTRNRRKRANASVKQHARKQHPTRKTSTKKVFQNAPRRGGRRPRGNRNPNGSEYGGTMITNTVTTQQARIENFDERIGTVLGSVAFQTTAFSINPGQSSTFPWLNKIAILYEKYEFEQLEFYFKHDVSQFAAQGTKGLVYLSCNYDATSPLPTTSTEIVDSEPKIFAMPNQDIRLRVDRKSLNGSFVHFVRPGLQPGGTDLKMYDAGMVLVSTEGMTDGSEIGKLHVRGRVKLMTRLLETPVRPPRNFVLSEYGRINALTPFILANATPTSMVFDEIITQNGLGVQPNASFTSFVLPVGRFRMFTNIAFQVGIGFTTACSIAFFQNGVQYTYPPLVWESNTPSDYQNGTLEATITSNGTDAFSVRVYSDPTGIADTNVWGRIGFYAY